jgi:heterodisulfide reductase subunit A-like polyferredoxin
MAAKVDKEVCTGCADCAEACPNESIKVVDQIAVVDEELCIDCSACVDACTSHAVALAD